MIYENQVSALPTNKALAVVGVNMVSLPFVLPAVQEVWPQIAPAFLAGPAMTDAVAALLSGLVGLAVAWFVRDRAGIVV
jgi:hypothetical protein